MLSLKGNIKKLIGIRNYGRCGPPRPPGPSQCPCPPPCGPPCSPDPPPPYRPGPIAPNPCCPIFHHGTDTWKKHKMIVIFICFPLILVQGYNLWGHHPPPKGDCRDFEYMRRRTKRFPWHPTKTLFHNDAVNFLPGECGPPELICE